MSTENYIAARTLEEALACLAQGDASILAGGTDLMPQSRAGRVKLARTLLYIGNIAELRGISEVAGGGLRIGALTTITELLDSEQIRARAPMLRQAADQFASDQVRNAATVGGNICNASPAGDTLPPLLALGAKLELASKPNGTATVRSLPIEEFFSGPGRSVKKPEELLTAVFLPAPKANAVSRFYKFGTRPALDISTVSIALAGVLDQGRLSNVRLAFGAVAATPLRARQTEAALEGKMLDAATIAAAAAAARNEVKPIDDVRASAWYRQELVHNMTQRMLSHVAEA